jgi:hypothetical protein
MLRQQRAHTTSWAAGPQQWQAARSETVLHAIAVRAEAVRAACRGGPCSGTLSWHWASLGLSSDAMCAWGELDAILERCQTIAAVE